MSWITLKDHDDYEIWSEHPYPIRKKSNHKVVTENIDTGGYWRLYLGGVKVYKHRILAMQFIPNPENLPESDHINRIKTDNRLENLRWCSKSDNSRNRTSTKGVSYEFIDELPDHSVPLIQYRKHKLAPGYYFKKVDGVLQLYLQVSENQYRILHLNYNKVYKVFYYNLMSDNNKLTRLSANVLNHIADKLIEDNLNQEDTYCDDVWVGDGRLIDMRD